MSKTDKVKKCFTSITFSEQQAARYNVLTKRVRLLTLDIIENTVESREQSLALTKLEEAMFWVNASIAREPQFNCALGEVKE